MEGEEEGKEGEEGRRKEVKEGGNGGSKNYNEGTLLDAQTYLCLGNNFFV